MTKTHDIIWLDEVDSTNTYVRNNIDRLDNLSVVASLSQTSGRGQGEHKWHSAPGENLLFSIVLKHPDIAASEQAAISMHTAESVRELLRHHNVDTWIKLPNDIWVADKKICGILIEHAIRGNHISWTIIGIGLNVNQSAFPDDLPNPTSIILETGTRCNINEILDEFMSIFSDFAWLK